MKPDFCGRMTTGGADPVDGAEQVDPEGTFPILGLEIVDPAVRREHARIADEDVEAAETLDRQRE